MGISIYESSAQWRSLGWRFTFEWSIMHIQTMELNDINYEEKECRVRKGEDQGLSPVEILHFKRS